MPHRIMHLFNSFQKETSLTAVIASVSRENRALQGQVHAQIFY